MAEVQKPAEVPETTPAVVEAAATEAVPAETAAATTEPAAETKPAETAAEEPAEGAAETTPAAEEAKKEVTPVEEGALEHKGAGAGFPKNLMFSKNYFWFGSEAVASEKLAAYLKNEKAAGVAHHVASWATETGKGLFFYGKESDKSTPHGIIPLADASEPATEGQNKFTIVANGQKHAFKAPNAADRDNWVSQLKLKIAEAKELATTVTESETYKKTLETLKPTPAPAAKKEEKPAAAAEETPAATEGAAATEETPAVVEPAAEAKEETKETKEEPKRRSASRKRASIFGNLLGGGKKEEKVVASEETPAVPEAAAETSETPAIVEPATEGAATEATPAAEEKPVKPTPTKRASLFGNLSFGKKKAEADPTATTPTAEAAPATEAAPVSENAPVIPAVETSEPLSTEVASPAAETTEATPAVNGEKKEMKTEKRKSSLPFTFGKKDKSAAASDEEGEKKVSSPLFSKLRQTVKGKGKEKPADKPAEVAEASETAEAAEDKPAEAAAAPSEETPAEQPLTASAPSAVPAAA